nr:cytochrome P450 6a2-like isoform X1 [Halyomorpha halys]
MLCGGELSGKRQSQCWNRDCLIRLRCINLQDKVRALPIMLLAIGLSLLVGWLLYKYYISIYDLWKKRGIPYYPSKFPFGCSHEILFQSRFQGHVHEEMYKKLAPNPLFGIFVMRVPMLVVRDPELIQMVLTKEFSHFRERMFIKISEKDVLNQHLFNLDGERWRALRVKLTPTFTSGKMKAMFPLFINCAEAFDSLILSKIGCDVEIKDLVGRLMTDIICSCAFGLDSNTIKDPDHKLRKISADASKMKFMDKVKIAILQAMPKLASKIEARFTPQETEDYIVKLVEDTIEYREKNNIKRNDFLDLLIQLKNKGIVGDDMKDEIEENKCQPFELTIGLMAAQSFVFLFAGFETSSSVQSFCLYELALNQDIQTKVKKEIDEIIEKHGGLTYQAVYEMEYLDMVISETMRKYPTLPLLLRYCTKSITTQYGYKIEAGDTIIIPVWALHYDPEYYPNPEKFDPERFSPQNRESIKPYTYLPFGEGPRMCIGMRFGQLQTKVGLITLLRKCRVEPCAATKIPMVIGPSPLLTISKDPIVLKLVPLS